MKTEIVAGKNPVLEILKAGKRRVERIFISRARRDKTLEEVEAYAKSRGVRIEIVSKEEIERISNLESPQGIAAKVGLFEYTPIERIVDVARENELGAFILILDSVQDPHNLGALIRTAHLMGVQGVVIPKDNAAEVGPVVVKASAGATEYVSIAQVTNISRVINYLKEKGIWVLGADSGAETSVYDHDFSGSSALVLGGEGKGLRSLVKKSCDLLLSIPMHPRQGSVGSYNVSVAGAIFMGEVFRYRASKGPAKNIPKSLNALDISGKVT